MTNIAIEQSLLKILSNYARRFEITNSPEDLLAIASSILTFQQKQGTLEIDPNRIEGLVHQVVDRFNAEGAANLLVDSATETLVAQVHQWRESLENQVLNTINVYVQRFQPDGQLNLTETILSVIPLVESFQLHKLQAESLIQQVKSKFDLQAALNQVIGTESLAIARKLAKLLQFGDLEGLLKQAISGDRQLNESLETITESLVNRELSKILDNSALQFNIDLDSQQLMVKQVTLKLNVMQSSPSPSKSNEEIAKQLDAEIERFKAAQQKRREVIDLTKPAAIGELDVKMPEQ